MNVTFNDVTNSIYCTFLNSQDSSDKLCNVSYSPCGDQLVQTAMGIANTERPNSVEIQLKFIESHAYCYVVAASNGTFQVLIEGRIMIREGDDQDCAPICPRLPPSIKFITCLVAINSIFQEMQLIPVRISNCEISPQSLHFKVIPYNLRYYCNCLMYITK